MLRAAFVFLALAAMGLSPAAAQRRVSLVIGISEYQALRSMVRPAGDARAVHEALTRLGFESDLVLAAGQSEFNAAVERFVAGLKQDDVALVHFTGHGARIGDDFVLLAADAPAQRPESGAAGPSGIGVYALAEEIRAIGTRAQILIVDACRGDPYAGGGADLAPSTCGDMGRQMPEGSFVLFSASAGQKALDRIGADDSDPHSLFTRTLLSRIGQVRSIGRLARVVREEVMETARSVNYEQRPAYLDELTGPSTLLAAREADGAAPPRGPIDPPSAPPDRQAIIVEPPVGATVEPRPPAPDVVVPPRPPAPTGVAEPFHCGAARPGPPAFDCRAARGVAEVAICRDPQLGSCDEVLNTVYERAQARLGRRSPGLRREQEDWLSQRDSCAAYANEPDALASCIGRLYDARIAELERIAAAVPALSRPSFDCRRARTPVEQAICAVPELAARDREMASLYERALFTDPARSRAAEESQAAWRSARDSCARAAPAPDALSACIEQAYNARIRDLRSLLAAR